MGFIGDAIGGVAKGVGGAVGGLFKPSIDQVDPTPEWMKPLQGDISQFLMNLYGGSNPFGGMTSDLQRQGTGAMTQFLNANPEQQVLDQLQPGLMDIFGGGAAQGVGQAALPVFQRELQRSLGGLSSAAPGRFGTAFASQGIDLASRAAQDFALVEANARMQELQHRLGAGSLLGTLAGQAGNNAFNRAATATQIGNQQTQMTIDPILQLMLGGLNFASPMGMDTVVGDSPISSIGGLAGTLVAGGGLGGIAGSILGGGGS